jgi:hypothetical protein
MIRRHEYRQTVPHMRMHTTGVVRRRQAFLLDAAQCDVRLMRTVTYKNNHA